MAAGPVPLVSRPLVSRPLASRPWLAWLLGQLASARRSRPDPAREQGRRQGLRQSPANL